MRCSARPTFGHRAAERTASDLVDKRVVTGSVAVVSVQRCWPVRISRAGELELLSKDGTLKMTVPVAYQDVNGKRNYVKAAYSRLSKNSYGFKVAGYEN